MTTEASSRTNSSGGPSDGPTGGPGESNPAAPPPPPAGDAATADHIYLAHTLEPALREDCQDRLGAVEWFRADWQRSGAATGFSTYRGDDGLEAPVVLKLPVVRREMRWIERLQEPGEPNAVIPHLHASGNVIGGYDLTWVIMERFEHGPLGLKWNAGHITRIAEAIARFHALAIQYEVDRDPIIEPWDEMVAEAIESVRVNEIPDGKQWLAALKSVTERLDPLVAEWRARDVKQWLHGDVHLANTMSRAALNEGPVSLIDLAEVHAGHWIEDAVFLERQLWARPQRMKQHRPVREIAAARRRLGLPVEDGYPRLAMIRRLLLAATAPRFIRTEGHPKHLAACLRWIETALADLKPA